MPWIIARIKGIMLTAGVITSTMRYASTAPQAARQSTFGEGLDGPGLVAQVSRAVGDSITRRYGRCRRHRRQRAGVVAFAAGAYRSQVDQRFDESVGRLTSQPAALFDGPSRSA